MARDTVTTRRNPAPYRITPKGIAFLTKQGFRAATNMYKYYNSPPPRVLAPESATSNRRFSNPFVNSQSSSKRKLSYASTRSLAPSVSTSTQTMNAKWKGSSTARYAGKFRRGRKPKPTIKTTSLQKGYASTLENFGRIGDADVAYIGHSTKHVELYARVLVAALLRELFMKAGLPVSSKDTTLDLSNFNLGNGFKINFQTVNVLSGIYNGLYDCVIGSSTSTFEDVIAACSTVVAWFVDFLVNTTNPPNDESPFRITLYSEDIHGGESSWRLCSQLNLVDHKVTFYAKSTLVVQNRTAGALAAGGVLDADRVDNQPLFGKIYTFSQASPRMTTPTAGNTELGRLNSNGLSLVRGSELSFGLQNCPDPKIWTNVAKVSNIVLQPGTMKQHTVTHKYSGKLITVLLRMRNAHTSDNYAYFTGGAGASQFIVLEEKLRTGSTNIITVQYERRLDVMAYCSPTKTPPLIARLTTFEINNFPV